MSGHSPEFIDSEFTVSTNDANKVAAVKAAIAANDHVFVFIYMDGCGHCVAAEAAWVEFTAEANNRPNVAAFAVSNAMMEEFKTEPEPALGEVETKNVLGDAAAGFPTFRYVHNSNEIDYNGGRSVPELIEWMDGATPSQVGKKNIRKRTVQIIDTTTVVNLMVVPQKGVAEENGAKHVRRANHANHAKRAKRNDVGNASEIE